MNQFKNNVSPTWRGCIYLFFLFAAFAWLGAITALTCNGQGYIQIYQGDNESQLVFAVSDNRVFVQPLSSPGDPMISYKILAAVRDTDSDEQFVRMIDSDGHKFTLLANRYNAVLCSEWGNTWYWSDKGTFGENTPATKGAVCNLIDFGVAQDGTWLHFYPDRVDLSCPGEEPWGYIPVDEIGSPHGTTVGYIYQDELPEAVVFCGPYPNYMPDVVRYY